ncbi:MAG: response regulator [Phycisphaerae bacterium]|nr:response regulator [Phycisphaerae bacterium]
MKKRLSTTEVARLLHASVASVASWIDQGRLVGGKTPGGHRRIEADDLVRFMRRQNLRIPPELIDGGGAVLVVDDERAIAAWLVEEIKTRHPDWKVFQAHDGFTAGDIVGASRPDVIILDIRMPGIDGLEVCRRIKSREDTRNIAVIAMTAHASQDMTEQILGAGARACFIKPLDITVVMREVESAMSKRR